MQDEKEKLILISKENFNEINNMEERNSLSGK